MSIFLHVVSLALWLTAIAVSGAVGMLIEEGNKKSAEGGYTLVVCFALCAFILQVLA
jgi:hypothetical protein